MVAETGPVMKNMVNIIKNLNDMERTAPVSAGKLAVGQTIKALVMAREGEIYHLQNGNISFRAQSETSLQVGAWLKLMVLGNRGDTILLKNLAVNSAGEEVDSPDRFKVLLKKFGITGTREIESAKELLSSIPCGENQAIRYLSSPHLVTGLLLPPMDGGETRQSIEISHYNSHHQQNIWEVDLELACPRLGNIEIAIKMVEGSISTRIWAQSPETERLLQERKEELSAMFPLLHIMPAPSGPLFAGEIEKTIDVRA